MTRVKGGHAEEPAAARRQGKRRRIVEIGDDEHGARAVGSAELRHRAPAARAPVDTAAAFGEIVLASAGAVHEDPLWVVELRRSIVRAPSEGDMSYCLRVALAPVMLALAQIQQTLASIAATVEGLRRAGLLQEARRHNALDAHPEYPLLSPPGLADGQPVAKFPPTVGAFWVMPLATANALLIAYGLPAGARLADKVARLAEYCGVRVLRHRE
jgi:hypothetical protein